MSAEFVASLEGLLHLPADRYGKRFRAVIASVDLVHRTRSARPIPVVVSRDRECTGRYNYHRGTGEPLSIEVSRRNNAHLESSFLHEIGHFLEHALIPGTHFGVRQWGSDEITNRWRVAVKATGSFQRLEDIAASGSVRGGDLGRANPPAGHFPMTLKYWMAERELWARSYAQWITLRSGNRTLAGQLGEFRSPPAAYPLQWNEAEFGPIAVEMDSCFDRIGWRR